MNVNKEIQKRLMGAYQRIRSYASDAYTDVENDDYSNSQLLDDIELIKEQIEVLENIMQGKTGLPD